MIYTLYDMKTGRIQGLTNSQTRSQQEPSVEGSWPADIYYIKNKNIKPFPPKPSSAFWHVYDWDLSSETWRLLQDQTDQAARAHRNTLFPYVDKVNPIWYASMSETQQRITQQYRKSLLDITEQKGYPVAIEWPNIPGFLRN